MGVRGFDNEVLSSLRYHGDKCLRQIDRVLFTEGQISHLCGKMHKEKGPREGGKMKTPLQSPLVILLRKAGCSFCGACPTDPMYQ